MKFAAMEENYNEDSDPAAWTLIAWADEREHKQVFGIDIPYMLSILSYNKLSGSVDGMDTVNKRLVEKYGDDKIIHQLTLYSGASVSWLVLVP